MDPFPFRFKQFSVAQDKCAMKVNTDGVLLGAWAEVSAAKSILDIGTGTGVIALMMAQRNEAIIDAIDIDEHAYQQAKENFEQSKWTTRLSAIHSSLQNFPSPKNYEAIISNPPYFIDDFKATDHQKNIARHSIALSYEDLLKGIQRLLAKEGKAFLVIPSFHKARIELLARKENLFVTKVTEVIAVKGKVHYLVLITMERMAKEIQKGDITIQEKENCFTSEYKELTKDFYLKF
jgi:tRNA1Val (adenine37-N6)-methyltransferase